MNDTVYAQIQLNGADNIASAHKPECKDVSGLVAREPYVYTESSYAYMYIGVSEGKAVDLRVKTADSASLAESVVCASGTNSISINPVDGAPLLELKTAAKTVKLTGDKLQGVNTPAITGFNIELSSGTTLSGAGVIRSVSLLNIPRLTLSGGSAAMGGNRGYGTALPTSAEVGEVFFLISE